MLEKGMGLGWSDRKEDRDRKKKASVGEKKKENSRAKRLGGN